MRSCARSAYRSRTCAGSSRSCPGLPCMPVWSTVPSAVATIGVPTPQAMSTPVCMYPTFVKGLVVQPNRVVMMPVAALERPRGGRVRHQVAERREHLRHLVQRAGGVAKEAGERLQVAELPRAVGSGGRVVRIGREARRHEAGPGGRAGVQALDGGQHAVDARLEVLAGGA